MITSQGNNTEICSTSFWIIQKENSREGGLKTGTKIENLSTRILQKQTKAILILF